MVPLHFMCSLAQVYCINLRFMKGNCIPWISRPGGRRIQGGAVRKVLDLGDMRPLVSRTVPGHINMMMKVVMVMMSLKKGLQKFDDLIIWKSQGCGIQTQHLGNNHPEIYQLNNGDKRM